MRISIKTDNGREIAVDVPQTHTFHLRGNQTFKLDRSRYDPKGLGRVVSYGEGRFLRDGAPSVVTVDAPKVPSGQKVDAQEWWKIADKTDGVEYDKEKRTLTIAAKRLSTFRKAGYTELCDQCDALLNRAAMEHAEARASALYSGDLPSARSVGLPEEVHRLRAVCIDKYREVTGCKVAEVPSTPDSVDALGVYFRAIPGIKAPKGQKSMDAWWDAIVAHIRDEIEEARKGRADLGI